VVKQMAHYPTFYYNSRNWQRINALFPGYFSRTCINLVLFNRSIAQLYLGVLIPCVAGAIFDSLLLF